MNTVIIGGGFAGVKAALELSRLEVGKVTLISNEPYFLHHATLYATATGGNHAESVVPLTDIFADHPQVQVIEDEMVSIDAARKIVIGKKEHYSYDNLVIAIGLVTTYFDIKGMDKHSFGIKTLEEVKNFSQHIQQDLKDDKHLQKHYVIVGGGPTGVELAGALAQYLNRLVKLNRLKKVKIRVSLVEAASSILPSVSKKAGKIAAKKLKALGVKVIVNHKVECLDGKCVTVEGSKIPTETVIWTSGVANNPFFGQHSSIFRLAPNGRVAVDEYLSAHKDIYVIGDNSNVKYTGMAYPALQAGDFIAKHLYRQLRHRHLRHFRPAKPVTAIPIGSNWAYVEWRGIKIIGKLGYKIRRLIELYGYLRLLPIKKALAAWEARHLSETDF